MTGYTGPMRGQQVVAPKPIPRQRADAGVPTTQAGWNENEGQYTYEYRDERGKVVACIAQEALHRIPRSAWDYFILKYCQVKVPSPDWF